MEKIKIAFLDIVGLRYDGDTLNKRGLGGSESATIYMAKELSQLDFDVTVFCKVENEGMYDDVRYLSNEKCRDNTEKFDILVTLRSCVPYIPIQYREQVLQETHHDIAYTLGLVQNSKFKALWLHDTFCSGDNWLEHICLDGFFDEIFTLSDWHTSYILNGHTWRGRIFEVLKNKIFQTRNGIKNYIEEVDIIKKDKDLFVYNSSVSKGLTPLLEQCWGRIKQNIPNAKLMVIGGYYRGANNDNPDEQELQWLKLKETYDGKDGVYFTGIITQNEIADILSKASLMVYPCAFPETFGISTLEAINYNCVPVTCNFGALEETATDSTSYKINYNIDYDSNQIDRFVNMVIMAYNNTYLTKQKMYACNDFKGVTEWKYVALQWKQHLLNKLDLYMPIDEIIQVRRVNSKIQRLFQRRFLNKEDITECSTQENSFTFITPVYNAENYIEKCIRSVANQTYENYKMVIIDDMSTDNTINIIKETINSLPDSIRNNFELKINEQKKYAVTNQVEEIQKYNYDCEIIILLDGDDWLVNDNEILYYLDRIYQNSPYNNMTYGSCHSLIDNIDLISEPYPNEVIKDKSFREHLFTWGMPYTHLRTFRKSLFNKIDTKCFKDENGDDWKAGGDNAIFYPLLENAESIRCLQRVIMVYNDTNPLNDYKINGEEQTKTANKIRGEIKLDLNNIDIHDIRELEKINDGVLSRDEESVGLLKDIITNREDVWVDDIENAPNIIVRKNWLKDKLESLNISKTSRILDIGSWTGGFANSFCELGYNNICCMDISKKAVELGKITYPNFTWICGDIEDKNLTVKFDVIIMFEVIEHLVNPIETLKKVQSYLTENGKIFFSIPIEEYINADGKSYEHISSISISQLQEFNAYIENLKSPRTNFEWYMGYIGKNIEDIDTTIKKVKKEIVTKSIVEKKTKILIGIPTAKNIETDTFKSIYNLIKPENTELVFECFYGYNIDQVRNLMAHYTIDNNFDYIFCVDSDIVLPQDSLIKLLAHKADIVSGVYRQRFLDICIPEFYINKDGKSVRATKEDIQKNQLLEVDSCGFGCTLISKSLLVKIGYPQFVYHSSIDFKDTISEDTDFCMKAKKYGSIIYIDTSIKCGHIGNFELKL